MRRIEIDEEVWQVLQKSAQPLIDSPNSVLRRLLGLDRTEPKKDDTTMMTAAGAWSKREPRVHRLVSARHCISNQEIWWYAIPPLGKKYQPSDRITFNLNNFHGKKAGELMIELAGRFLERIDRAPKDKKGNTHVKLVRELGSSLTTIYFGKKVDDQPPEPVDIREV